MEKSHKSSYRVYYEDTDGAGIVYHANYLKFAERARTDFLREVGINQSELLKKDGVLFVVRSITMDLLKPAKLDDLLEIDTFVERITPVSMNFVQKIVWNDIFLNEIKVRIACVNTHMKPTKMPLHVKNVIDIT